MAAVRVALVGIIPEIIDFDDLAYAAFPGMNAAKVRAGLEADVARLNGLGYSASLCLVDFGETAEQTVLAALTAERFDCVLIGAGVRLIPKNTPLLEKLVNVVHANAADAKICFNSGPFDSAEAVQRWFPEPR